MSSTTVNIGELLNLVGLSAGVVLYAMLLAMVVGTRRAGGPQAKFDPLLLLTALLGLVWNLCALPANDLPKVGIEGPFPFLAVAGYGALGFLPAVVVHSVLRGQRDEIRGPAKHTLAAVAYGVSAVAVVLHLDAAMHGATVPSALGMRLLTYTYVAMVAPLVVVTRRQPGARRALWVAALAVFAVSALHLSQFHRGDNSWPVELVGHHASLPLAFAILYQDYPFALADLFLKRALALLAIVGIVFIAIAMFAAQSVAFMRFEETESRGVVLLVVLWVGTALLYPLLRQATARFVDAVVLHRPDYTALRASVSRAIQTHDEVPALLSDVCGLLRPALACRTVSWREREPGQHDGVTLAVSGAEAVTIVATSDAPSYAITIAGLTGGRRFLSDDIAMLEAIAVMIARRIDAIRVTNERYHQQLREREMGRLATEAELRALRAQVNPHFLFNALTTIGHLIQTAPPRALDTLLHLTTLLRAVLRSEGEFTTLGRELEVIEAYLDIERARFDERLAVSIDVPRELRDIRLPPLVLQPLVENAVKHGISQKERGGRVTIRAHVEHGAHDTRELVLTVQDTGAGATPGALQRGRTSGVGMQNVERRLLHQYGPSALLSIESVPGVGTVVEIRIPATIDVSEIAAASARAAR